MAGNADITPRLVGERLFNLDLRVDTGIINTAVEGQTATLSTSGTNMIGKNAIIFYANPSANLKSRTLGITIHTDFGKAYKWSESPKSNFVAVSHMTAEELVSAAFGYRITSVVS
jgi:hypothetical protein